MSFDLGNGADAGWQAASPPPSPPTPPRPLPSSRTQNARLPLLAPFIC